MKKLKIILQSKVFLVIFLSLLGLYVFVSTKIVNYESKYNIFEKEIKGKVTFYKIDGDKLTITIKAKEKVIVNYYFKSQKEKINYQNNLNINNIIFFKGEFVVPQNNTIPNTFNYKKYLYNQKIYMIFNASEIKIIKKGFSIKNIFIKRLNKFKRKDYLYALVLGDKSYLDMSDFQDNGVSHLFAISGMHVGFLISFLEKKLKIRNKFLINVILWIYLYLVSFSIGALRVILFKTLNEMLKKININVSSKRLTILIAGIILLINPFFIYDYGFLYSFIISYGIMCIKITGNYFVTLLKISFISFVFSFPLLILMNYEINLMSVFNNLYFVPLISFVIFPLALITFLFPIIEPILNVFLLILEWTNKNILSINIIFPKINVLFVLIYYCLVIWFIKHKSFNKLLLIMMLILLFKYNYMFTKNYQIYFLSVGQGDCSLIYFPKIMQVIMIDTGGKFNLPKENWRIKEKSFDEAKKLKVFLNSKGISKINKLILTHGDFDHMGDAINLVNNFKVEKVIFNCGKFNDLEKELISVLNKKKIKYYSCIKELNFDNNKLYFLNDKDYGNENDNSIVLYTELNNHKFLFMGDASVKTEKDITDKYNLKDIDVIKVGHHGSKTSSSEVFINKINPKYSVISVGKNNRYGHPNSEVLDVLDNSKIYRTDIDGSIMFKIKNNKLDVNTCPP